MGCIKSKPAAPSATQQQQGGSGYPRDQGYARPLTIVNNKTLATTPSPSVAGPVKQSSAAAANPAPKRVAPVAAGPIQNPKVGDRVSVRGYACPGTIRFVGSHHVDKESERLGIELDKPLGKNNGTIKGHMYFECPENYGLLVYPSKVVPYGTSLLATVKDADRLCTYVGAQACKRLIKKTLKKDIVYCKIHRCQRKDCRNPKGSKEKYCTDCAQKKEDEGESDDDGGYLNIEADEGSEEEQDDMDDNENTGDAEDEQQAEDPSLLVSQSNTTTPTIPKSNQVEVNNNAENVGKIGSGTSMTATDNQSPHKPAVPISVESQNTDDATTAANLRGSPYDVHSAQQNAESPSVHEHQSNESSNEEEDGQIKGETTEETAHDTESASDSAAESKLADEETAPLSTSEVKGSAESKSDETDETSAATDKSPSKSHEPIRIELALSEQDMGTYQGLWNSLPTLNQLLQASEAFSFFVTSGLDQGVLRTIWSASDTEEPRGQLSENEFYRACKLVAAAQEGLEVTTDSLNAKLPIPHFEKVDLSAQSTEVEPQENDAGEDSDEDL